MTEAERFPAPELESNLRAGCPFRSDYVTAVTLGDGYWGAWPECFDWCPEVGGRSFAYSLWLRSDPSQGSNDDTGLNSVALDCYNQSNWAYRGFIDSYVQFFGSWTDPAVCATHPITGGEIRISRRRVVATHRRQRRGGPVRERPVAGRDHVHLVGDLARLRGLPPGPRSAA